MPYQQSEPTISSLVLLSLYNDLSEHRDIFEEGLRSFGIGRHEMQDLHGYIKLRDFVALFEWLAAALREPFLGLKISQRTGPDALGAVGYLFLSSGTPEAAVNGLSHYLDAVQSSSRLEVKYIDDLVQIRYRITDDGIAPRRQDSEYSIGLIWRYIKTLSKNRCRLTQVSFEHEKPKRTGTVPRRIFGAPVLYGTELNELTIPRTDYQEWHAGLDPHLFPILEDHITNTLQQLRQPATFSELVLRMITEQILSSGARAKLIADMLEISTVTLHRRLREEGFRFKELTDSRSKALADRLLRHGNLPMAVISGRLGFSDPATFSRAFRRWYDTTPRQYRKEIRQQRVSEFRSGH